MEKSLSNFGKKLGTSTGIGELMDDLGEALVDKSRIKAMLGGGQPSEIPAMTERFYHHLNKIISSPEDLHRVLGQYDPAEGETKFRTSFAKMMNALYGFTIQAENVGISSGGQSACFHLLNALVGNGEQVLIPLLPDYMGYRDQLVSGAKFQGIPGIPVRKGNRFKYSLDRDKIQSAPETVKVMVLSRPTNPSGNVISDEDISFLSSECKHRGIPLIIDHAYGAPFPNAVYVKTTPKWYPHHIHLYSLSKLGLPSTRTSIIVADSPIISLMRKMTAVTSLANPGLGQALIRPMIKDLSLPKVCQEEVTPFYQAKRDHAVALIDKLLEGKADYSLHAPEGAFFLWLWLPGIDTKKLATSLKEKGVLVISGHWFFYGQQNTKIPHQSECLRLTYSMPQEEVETGLKTLTAEIIKPL